MMKKSTIYIIILFTMLATSCTNSIRFASDVKTQSKQYIKTEQLKNISVSLVGKASFYSNEFNGRRTASGEIFNMNNFTAAHKTLPFGTIVKVKNLKNGASTTVKINDRGPYAEGRIIDLSEAAAEELDMIKDGVIDVQLEIIE